MPKGEQVHTFYFDLVRETDKAYLVETGTGEEIWLPKSQVEYDNQDGSFQVPDWLAAKNDLI